MASELLRLVLALTFGSVLGVIAVLALRRPARHFLGAGAAYSLWWLVPVAMPSVLMPHIPATGAMAVLSALPESPFPLSRALRGSLDSLTPAASSAVDGAFWGLCIWAVGAAIFACYLIAIQRSFLRRLGRLSGASCVLRAERSTGCPVLIGVLRPKIVLPADFRLRYTRAERLLIFSHERTHLRRGDAAWNALIAVVRCIFWYNPLMHVMAHCFRLDQELACDAAVLYAHPGSRRPYANAMLKTQLPQGALPISCLWRSAQDLKERLRMIGRTAPNHRRRPYGVVVTPLLAFAVAYTAWTAEPRIAGTVAPQAASPWTPGGTLIGWIAQWSGWLIAPNHFANQPVTIAVRGGRLFLARGATQTFHADETRAVHSFSPGGIPTLTTTLEGHVHLIFTPPTGGPAQATMLDANRAVLVEHPDGDTEVQVDEGTVRAALPPQSVGPQIQAPLLTVNPNRLIPNFKDADIGQVAQAVAISTRKTFLIDPRIHVKLTMLSMAPMTPDAFYQAFKDILHTGDLIVLPMGPTENAVKITMPQ